MEIERGAAVVETLVFNIYSFGSSTRTARRRRSERGFEAVDSNSFLVASARAFLIIP